MVDGGTLPESCGGDALGDEDPSFVLDLIKAGMDDAGVSVTIILEQVTGKFGEHEVKEAIEWLSSEGHVYSTIDDDHFKSTDG